jgi:predicted DsbA family dithiol-disulfide isomerase
MTERLKGIAAAVGLNYDMEHMHMTNTVLAHQLLHYAKTQGKQVQMKERIMSAHFVEALHVGRIDVLAQLAADIGLDRAEVMRVLESGEFIPAFEADVEQARAYGISGVPFFVIEGKYGVSGAQNSEVFVGAFNQVLEERG